MQLYFGGLFVSWNTTGKCNDVQQPHTHPTLQFWDVVGCGEQGCFLWQVGACSASRQVPAEDSWNSMMEIAVSTSCSARWLVVKIKRNRNKLLSISVQAVSLCSSPSCQKSKPPPSTTQTTTSEGKTEDCSSKWRAPKLSLVIILLAQLSLN